MMRVREENIMTQDYIPTDTDAGGATNPEVAPDTGTYEPATAPAGSSEAWRDVVEQLNGLGEAIGRWASAAASDPSYREHAAEFKAGVEKIASSIGDAFDDATRSDVGQQLADAATRTGEAFKTAGERVSQEAAPRIASVFGKAAAGLQRAAERMERPSAAGEPPAESPVAPPIELPSGPPTPEPPAPIDDPLV
ncbi:MAG: hypothetical protein ACYC6C_05475 [Coriobacteriia bacterium]